MTPSYEPEVPPVAENYQRADAGSAAPAGFPEGRPGPPKAFAQYFAALLSIRFSRQAADRSMWVNSIKLYAFFGENQVSKI